MALDAHVALRACGATPLRDALPKVYAELLDVGGGDKGEVSRGR
jgi:hypothetical protein